MFRPCGDFTLSLPAEKVSKKLASARFTKNQLLDQNKVNSQWLIYFIFLDVKLEVRKIKENLASIQNKTLIQKIPYN